MHVHVHAVVVKRGTGFWLMECIAGLVLYHPLSRPYSVQPKSGLVCKGH